MEPIDYNPRDTMGIELRNDKTGEVYVGEYVDMRISRDTIPEGKFAYDCRHDDCGDWVTPATIENKTVIVNFSGVFITDTLIDFGEFDYVPVTEAYEFDEEEFTE